MKPDRFEGKRNEWITPKPIIDAFRKTIARSWAIPFIDPFSPPDNPVGADVFYTEAQDSLSFDWPEDHAVWANPPFSRGQLRPCLERLRKEWANDRPGMLLLPINNRLETGYYQELCLCDELTAIVFVRGRVAFEERIEDELIVRYEPRKSNMFATHILAYNIASTYVSEFFSDIGKVIEVC